MGKMVCCAAMLPIPTAVQTNFRLKLHPAGSQHTQCSLTSFAISDTARNRLDAIPQLNLEFRESGILLKFSDAITDL